MEGFYTGTDFTPNIHNGFPIQEISNIQDFASFDYDSRDLDVPKGITCIFIVMRKSNYAELTYHWTHHNQKSPEN